MREELLCPGSLWLFDIYLNAGSSAESGAAWERGGQAQLLTEWEKEIISTKRLKAQTRGRWRCDRGNVARDSAAFSNEIMTGRRGWDQDMVGGVEKRYFRRAPKEKMDRKWFQVYVAKQKSVKWGHPAKGQQCQCQWSQYRCVLPNPPTHPPQTHTPRLVNRTCVAVAGRLLCASLLYSIFSAWLISPIASRDSLIPAAGSSGSGSGGGQH